MTIYIADEHAHVQRLVSIAKMATVLQECTTEEQRSVVRFLREIGLNAKDIHKEIFPVYGESICPVKLFTTGSTNSPRTFESRN
jgi:hypothetical protein